MFQRSCTQKRPQQSCNCNSEVEVPKRRYISPEERQQVIELRLV